MFPNLAHYIFSVTVTYENEASINNSNGFLFLKSDECSEMMSIGLFKTQILFVSLVLTVSSIVSLPYEGGPWGMPVDQLNTGVRLLPETEMGEPGYGNER